MQLRSKWVEIDVMSAGVFVRVGAWQKWLGRWTCARTGRRHWEIH